MRRLFPVMFSILFGIPALLGAAVIAPLGVAEAAEPTVEELLDAADDANRGASSHGKMSMQVKTDRYERSMEMEVWTRGTEDSLIRILSPAKEKGMSTLKVGDNIWNYMPKIDRTMKISGAAMSGQWMGSHITNDDLVKQSRMREDYTYTLTAKPDAEGKGVYRVELVPKPEAPVVWGKVVLDVRSDRQPVQIAYFDEKGELVRTMKFLDIQEMGGRTLPATLRVEPADAPAEFTEIRYSEMQFDVELGDRIFSLQSLKR